MFSRGRSCKFSRGSRLEVLKWVRKYKFFNGFGIQVFKGGRNNKFSNVVIITRFQGGHNCKFLNIVPTTCIQGGVATASFQMDSQPHVFKWGHNCMCSRVSQLHIFKWSRAYMFLREVAIHVFFFFLRVTIHVFRGSNRKLFSSQLRLIFFINSQIFFKYGHAPNSLIFVKFLNNFQVHDFFSKFSNLKHF